MIRSKAVIEIKIGDNLYQMECPSNAQLGEVHDALVQMRQIVVNMMQAHADQEQKEIDEEEQEND
jgi:hypothetical protein